MFTILVARSAGFCRGVKRAVARVETLAARAGNGRVVTIGALIHNRREVERLRAAGVEPLELAAVADMDTVVIRTHGVRPEEKRRLAARPGLLVDATCPYVRSVQTLASRMAAKGYAVLVAGDPGHPETDSVICHASEGAEATGRSSPALVVSTVAGLDAEELHHVRRVAVLAQTTLDRARLAQLVAACAERFVEVRAFNTICAASVERQREACALAQEADTVVVVGDRGSANTRRLESLCAAIQPRTLLVESAAELDRMSVEGARCIAVTSGASTPLRTVDEVVARLAALGE